MRRADEYSSSRFDNATNQNVAFSYSGGLRDYLLRPLSCVLVVLDPSTDFEPDWLHSQRERGNLVLHELVGS